MANLIPHDIEEWMRRRERDIRELKRALLTAGGGGGGGLASQELILVWDGASYNVPGAQPAGVIVRHFYGPNPPAVAAWPGVLDVYEYADL